MPRRVAVVSVVAMSLIGVRGSLAQDRTVTGIVADSGSGKSLADATFYLDHTAIAQATKKDGKFQLVLGTEESVIYVHRYNYVPKRVTIAAGATDIGTIGLRPVKTDADRAVVNTEGVRLYPQLNAFYKRRATLRQGYFFAPEDIERSGARQLSDLLRLTQGLREMCLVNRQGALDCGVDPKRGTTYSGFRSGETSCAAAVWTAGVAATLSLDEILIADVLAMEAYASAATTPTAFSGSRCGVIVLWMKAP